MSPISAIRRKLPAAFWINIGVIAISLPLFLLTLDYPGMSGTFPRLVLIMIMGLALADLISVIVSKEATPTASAPPEKNQAISLESQGKVLYLAGLMFVFFAFMHLLGVILGTFVFILLSGWTLGYKRFFNLCISSVIVAVSVYLIFVVIMDCFLPKGYLIGLIGG